MAVGCLLQYHVTYTCSHWHNTYLLMEYSSAGKNRLESLSKKGCIVGLIVSEEILGAERSIQMDHLADNSNFVLGMNVHFVRRINLQTSLAFN